MAKHSAIYDQGSSSYREDGLIFAEQISGVLDGVSAPFSPQHPIRLFKGLSGGEMVSRYCELTAYECRTIFYKDLPLRQFLESLVLRIAVRLNAAGLTSDDLKDGGALPGATFALARLFDEKIEVVQAGDCVAVIELRNSEIVVSPQSGPSS